MSDTSSDKSNIKRLLISLEQHASSYLKNEAQLHEVKCSTTLEELKSLSLHDITAIISVAENLNMILAFSYETPLLEKITQMFLYDGDGGKVSQDDCQDMASEFINIITGLCITSLNQSETPILFSPPIVINEAKEIHQRESTHLFAINIKTEFGVLNINCIGPGELFDERLNYVADKK